MKGLRVPMNRNGASSRHPPLLFCVLFLLLSCLVVLSVQASDAGVQKAMQGARELLRADKYGEAEAILTHVLQVEPRNQKATLLLGLNQRFAGRYDDAVLTLLRAVDLGPGTYEAGQAVFVCAKTHNLAGRSTEALALIRKLDSEYPDSGWLPQGRVLEAEITGKDMLAAKQRLDAQNAAEREYKAIIDKRAEVPTSATIAALQSLCEKTAGLPIEYTAKESVGNLLASVGSTNEAVVTFTELLDRLGETAPNSRIVQIAHARLAALYLRMNQQDAAIQHFLAAAAPDAPDADVAQNGLLQAAGATFEVLQRAVWAKQQVSLSEWQHLLSMLHRVRAQPNATKTTTITADLMELEVYQWLGWNTTAIDFGTTFVKQYSDLSGHRREIATACVTVARSCKEARRYHHCIQLTQKVLTLYPNENEIWPRMDHIERTYYDMIESLFILAYTDQAESVLREFRARFPASEYMKIIEDNRVNLYRILREQHVAQIEAQ